MLSADSGCLGEPRQKAPDGARPLGSETCWIVAAERLSTRGAGRAFQARKRTI